MNVSARARNVKQPRGGYLPVSKFFCNKLTDDQELFPEENIHSSIVGIAVDNLTRVCAGVEKKEVFNLELHGASAAGKHGYPGSLEKACFLMTKISGADEQSVINACKLATFEVWVRSGYGFDWKGPDQTNPDHNTVRNIQIMLSRTKWWLDTFQPLIKAGFTFQPKENATRERYREVMESGVGSWGGYTPTVSSGDGDYLTKGIMWDLKSSKDKPTSKNSLQLLMYWIMGQHSGQDCFNEIDIIGFFNPRRFEIYMLTTDNIDPELISTVEKDVICY